MRRSALLLAGLGALVCALIGSPTPTPFEACPLSWQSGTTPRWPDSTTIHIYIPEMPDDEHAADSVRAGIQRWAGMLAAKGIKLEFHMGQSAPPGATNAVDVQWVPPGTLGGRDALASPQADPSGTRIVGGTIQIEVPPDGWPSDFYLPNTGIHEFGHILGLDEDPTEPGQTHNAMDPAIPDTPSEGFSGRDSAEVRSLYGIEGGHAQAEAQGESEGDAPSGLGGQAVATSFTYHYWVYWLAGPEIPVFEVSLNCHPSTVLPVSLPPNWILDYPPAYWDAAPVPAADSDTPKLRFRAMGAGLSAAQPVGYFAVSAPAPPGPGWGHAMADNDGDGVFDLFPLPVPTDPVSAPAPGGLTSGRLVALPAVPNPSPGTTRIRFVAPRPFATARVEVFDLRGARVWSSVVAGGAAGPHEVAWDGRSTDGTQAPPGVYRVTVTAAGERTGRLLVRVR